MPSDGLLGRVTGPAQPRGYSGEQGPARDKKVGQSAARRSSYGPASRCASRWSPAHRPLRRTWRPYAGTMRRRCGAIDATIKQLRHLLRFSRPCPAGVPIAANLRPAGGFRRIPTHLFEITMRYRRNSPTTTVSETLPAADRAAVAGIDRTSASRCERVFIGRSSGSGAADAGLAQEYFPSTLS